ncbi:MAG: hypothetical protein AAB368_12235, partial [bacterium]
MCLKIFSGYGGIEILNSNAVKVLSENINDFTCFSLHDTVTDNKYIDKSKFKYFNGSKVKYILSIIPHIYQCKILIISHINLIRVAALLKILNPKIKMYLFVYGIEVWNLSKIQYLSIKYIPNNIISISKFTKSKLIEQNIDAKLITIINPCLDYFFEKNTIRSCNPIDLINRYGI